MSVVKGYSQNPYEITVNLIYQIPNFTNKLTNMIYQMVSFRNMVTFSSVYNFSSLMSKTQVFGTEVPKTPPVLLPTPSPTRDGSTKDVDPHVETEQVQHSKDP